MYDIPSLIEVRKAAGINYAYEFKITDEMKLRGAASLSYVSLNLDSARVFSLNKETLSSQSAAYFGLGALLTYKNTFLGISAFKFTGPLSAKNSYGKTVFVDDISAQAGGFFPTNKSNAKSTVIAPGVLLYGKLGNLGLAPGVKISKGIVTGGITYYQNYLENGAIAVLAGISKGWIKAGYTYDFGIPDARSTLTGSHELNLTVYPSKATADNKDLAYYFRKMGF